MGYRIRHIAIRTDDPRKLAQFYVETFGMTELERNGEGRAIYLSDGHVTLAILAGRPGAVNGLDHFGFQVDSMEEVGRSVTVNGGSAKLEEVPRDGRFVEFKVQDPAGTSIDLSESGWGH